MIVKSLSFENFRNLETNSIKPCENINVIYGNNAQGKTNILEALWMFCGGHSFRGTKDKELIQFGKNNARIKVEFFAYEREQSAEIIFRNGKREVIINGVKKPSTSALISRYTAVIFSPEDLTLIKRGPSARRRFIDSAICREKLQNAVLLSKYNQTLNQRNALIKDIHRHPELKKTIDIWDDTLSILGTDIILNRIKYVELLTEYCKMYHLGISENKEILKIKYISSFELKENQSKEQIRENFNRALKKSRDEDFKIGYTNIGPHRDDFEIIINEKKAKIFASQGQQRSAVLSLKLAEAHILNNQTGEKPVILLDDVLSELDKKRQDFLLNKIMDYQVFITCCQLDDRENIKNGKCFYVEEGKVE